MKFIQLASHSRARVWFGNGVSEYSAAGSLMNTVEPGARVTVRMPRVTVEAYVPRGGFAEYGLLGMRFEPATDGALRIEVPYSNDGNRWPEALAAAIDDVHLGLPREYAQPILDAASAHAARRFPPGTITLVEAAHGRIGSNSRLFSRIAVCVLELMEDEHPRSDEDLASLLRKRLVETNA